MNYLSSGWTPLGSAVRNGYDRISELLIESGADVNAKIDEGWAVLHFASKEGIILLIFPLSEV